MPDPSLVVQLLLGGLLLGGIYAMTALGLSLIFGVSRVLNLAHGDFVMLGGLAAFVLFSSFSLNPFLSLVVLVPLFLVVGGLYERLFIRPIADKAFHERLIASVLVTLGLSLAISDTAAFFWGTYVKGISISMPTVELLGIFLPLLRLLTLAVIVVLTVALHQFLFRSYLGRAIRALAQNRQGALLVGINSGQISAITFGVGTALAALAGVFYLLLFTVSPYIGMPLVLKALTIIVLGGLGSLMGALWGGVILGVAETMTGFWLGDKWSPTVATLLLLAVLVVRPRGLFGRRD
jgi:branched-chain amino acid transport system permease protein